MSSRIVMRKSVKFMLIETVFSSAIVATPKTTTKMAARARRGSRGFGGKLLLRIQQMSDGLPRKI